MKHKTVAMIFVAINLCIGCQDAELRPAHYPAGVPSYEIWAGGADGGAYISCTSNLPRNANYCRVWNDSTDEVAESGDYPLQMQHRGASQDELKFCGADFDGEIYLQNGRTLSLLKKSQT